MRSRSIPWSRQTWPSVFNAGFFQGLWLPPKSRLLLQLWPLTSVHNLRRIDGILVHLLFENCPIFADQEIHAPCGFIFFYIEAVFSRHLTAPIAQQRECDSNLIGEGFVRKGAIHAHTQDLGVGRVEPFQ